MERIKFEEIEKHLIEKRGLKNSMTEFLMFVNECNKETANRKYKTFVWSYANRKLKI